MLRGAELLTESADGRDISLQPLLLGAVSLWGEFDERVERNLHPGATLLRDVHEVGVDAA